MDKKFYKINRQITAPTIRLLSDDGKQIGIVSLSDAFQQSQETGFDLVEINGKATPPVVKLIEFSKFKYQEAKKAKAEKKGIKGGLLACNRYIDREIGRVAAFRLLLRLCTISLLHACSAWFWVESEGSLQAPAPCLFAAASAPWESG